MGVGENTEVKTGQDREERRRRWEDRKEEKRRGVGRLRGPWMAGFRRMV